MAFGTPIAAYQWPDSEGVNAELRALILAKEAADAGILRSNAGGWHSDVDLFEWDADCIRVLRARVERMLIGMTRQVLVGQHGERSFSFRIDGWANVNRHGDYNNVHNHPNCLWSGVYYVAPGQPEEGRANNGKLELLDPRVGVNVIHLEGSVLGGRFVVDPLPGLMIMFPSWLNHLVHPFFGAGERISIAFNILTQPAKAAG